MKGQEDAPFEILIGIIIFVSVLSISSYIFEDYMKYQEEAKLDVELSNLANKIEAIADQAPGSKDTVTVDFSVPMTGGSTKITYLTLRQIKNTKECLKNVGLESCWVIEVHAKNNWNSDFVIKKRYIKVPADINFDAEVENPSKEYECDNGDFCLKMVRYVVEIYKESRNKLKLSFR